jgi:hypothetical protein
LRRMESGAVDVWPREDSRGLDKAFRPQSEHTTERQVKRQRDRHSIASSSYIRRATGRMGSDP